MQIEFSVVFFVPLPNLEARLKPKLLFVLCALVPEMCKLPLSGFVLLSFLEVHAFSMFSFQPAAALVNVVLS